MRGDLGDGCHVNDGVLVCKRRDELVEGIRVGDVVDLDVWREGGLGGRGGAGEDSNVACEARVGIEGGEDGGTEVAGSLSGGLVVS